MFELTLTNFLLALLITSFWCIGVYKIFEEGMIFGWLARAINKNIPPLFTKPVYNCCVCMGSLHGLIAFNIFFGLFSLAVIPFMICLAGLNWLLASIAER